MKKTTLITLALLIIFLLTACGAKVATPVGVTVTPDPCSKENLPGEVTKINDLMREFDDYSRLASSTPQDKLVQVIPPLQEVRRRAEAQKAPQCLMNLKVLQINHMNTVIEILMVFMGNAQDANVNEGIAQARELHMQYDAEIARLLGLTLVPAPTFAPATPEANTLQDSATQPAGSGLSILNPGPDGVVLLSTPDLKAGGVATLAAGLTAVAFGQSADGLWIQVEVPGQPGQKAWVSAALVQVSGQLPVVVP
jgi:hypothetical protein